MGNRLAGKVAVVTGAGRGIGRGVAMLLIEEGASVVVNDLGCDIDGSGRSQTPADQVVEEIKSSGGKAVANYDDVGLMDGGKKVIQTAVDTFGQLDVLVNSAGVLVDRMIHQMTPDEFDEVIRKNLKAAFTPTKFAAPLFRKQRSGRIVNMCSEAGLGSAGRSNYAAASEGIVGFTRTVAIDLERYGVTCNAISPSARTRLFPGEKQESQVDRGIGLKAESVITEGPEHAIDLWDGVGAPDDPANVAPLAVYLCSQASQNINGHVFGVSGGSIFLYSNPSIERSIHKWGRFTTQELDSLVPKIIGAGSRHVKHDWS